MTVNELIEKYLFLVELSEDPDVDEEALKEAYEDMDGDITDKIEGLAVIRSMRLNDAEACRKEADRLTKRARAFENNAKSLLDRIEYTMRACDKQKLKTEKYSFNIQKNPPSLVIDDEHAIPPEYIVIKQEANKAAIKEAIKAGETFSFAHMEQTEGLRIR